MLVKLDFKSEVPLYLQLRNEIVLSIGRGSLQPGESLPSVRQFAQDAGINTMTVNKAYTLLKSEGFISIDRRHGATVNGVRRENDAAESLESHLELTVSEAGLRGISENEFLALCKHVYSKMDGLKNQT